MTKKEYQQNIRKEWPAAGQEIVSDCPVCGSRERHLLHGELVDRIFFCAPGVWSLYQCTACESAYLDPRPTVETIDIAYETYYTHKAFVSLSEPPTGGLKKLRRSLNNGYRNWRFGTNFLPSIAFGKLVVAVIPRFRHIIEREGRSLPRAENNSRLLDVGFGDGAFLDFAQKAGWGVVGVDTDAKTVGTAFKKGFEVRQGDIFSFPEQSEEFDVITLSHVIEHVHDPRAVIREAYRLLKPGGRIWLETPNIGSYGHSEFGPSWRGLEPPRHLVLFNWASMQRLLRDGGFELVRSLLRFGTYPSLAAKSRAISTGTDPYKTTVTVRDRIIGQLVDLRTQMNPNCSEFITMLAVKPSRQGIEER